MNKAADRPFNVPLPAVSGFAPLNRASSPRLGRECGCDAEKIRVIHQYLTDYFPHYALRDLHAPSTRVREGIATARDEQHVVRITHPGVLPYYAILLTGFLDQSSEQVREQLRRWAVADVVRRNRIAVISSDGPSPL